MKSNICLLLVLIALLSFIIISGCGGSSNSINPASSITTPTPAGDFGYITVDIAWPQGNKDEKKCLITSENGGKTITASMPGDTISVIVKIRDIRDKDDVNKVLDPNNAVHHFDWDPSKDFDSHKLGPLPAIKVIVRAEAYTASSAEIPISVAEQEFQIKPGDPPPEVGDYNVAHLALGNYNISLTPTAPSAGDTSCDAVINTSLSIEYPTPAGTPATPSPKPVGNRTLKFEVSNVRYTGLTPNVTVVPEDIVIEPSQLPLDGNGTGRVKVTANIKPVTATIMSMLMNSDETDILSWKECDVVLGSDYIIRFTKIEPDRHAPYTQSGSLTSTLNTELLFGLSNNPSEPPVPISGKVINFTIVNPVPSGSGYTVTNELSSNSATTTTTGLWRPLEIKG